LPYTIASHLHEEGKKPAENIKKSRKYQRKQSEKMLAKLLLALCC
jgi:hypothetical protein